MTYDYTGTDLIPKGSLRELVAAHDRAVAEADRIVADMRKLQTDFVSPYIGKKCKHDYNFLWSYHVESDLPQIRLKITQSFWKHVIDRSGVKSLMDHKRRKKLDEQMRDIHNLPPFDMATVHGTIYGWAESSQDVFEQMVQTTYKDLIPYRNEYKTNKRYRIGKKIIRYIGLNSMFNMVEGYYKDMWRDLDRIFHQLDKKTPPEHGQDLVCRLEMASREGFDELETEYFDCKWFKNGNLHLKFIREDLLQEFNRIGAKQFAGQLGEAE